ERCLAYKEEAQVDVVCPNDLKTWDEIKEAIRRIPGPVVPLIPASIRPYPSLEDQRAAGAAAAWFPALTTMAGLQANWDFLNDFQARGTRVIDELRERAVQSPWGVASNAGILGARRVQDIEDRYIPGELEHSCLGSVSKVGMATPMTLIYKELFSSISTFETPPGGRDLGFRQGIGAAQHCKEGSHGSRQDTRRYYWRQCPLRLEHASPPAGPAGHAQF